MASDRKHIHALIIGIDSYTKRTPLNGAVNDALDFEKYLGEQGVPAENIELLRDAKRTVIVEAIQSLRTKDAIEKGKAAIIIFFAGHGASSAIPKDWNELQSVQVGGRIEQLCPVDIGEETDSGNVIQGIPDYDIRVWLDDLSQAKGNNITVILDCCHSGGMNRDANNIGTDWVARCIEDPPELSDPPSFVDHLAVTAEPPVDLLSGTRAVKAVPEFAGTARESHILLAACNRDQTAHESKRRGHFTTALLHVLRKYPLEGLTYKTLMHLLAMPRHDDHEKIQTPHCDGRFIRRRLFDSWSPEADAGLILCHRNEEATSFTLQAGAIHGVTVGSEYEIFGIDFLQASPTAPKAIVEKVKPFTSTLRFSPDVEIPPARDGRSRDVRYARLFKEADLEVRLHCSDGNYLKRIVDIPDQGPTVTISETPTDADLVLKLDGTHVSFERGNKTIIVEPDLGFTSLLSGQVPIDDVEHVRHVVKSYTRFLKHLTRAVSLPDGQDVIKLSLHRLQRTGRNLDPVGEDLLKGKPDVTVMSDGAYYGFTLKNLSNVRLFAYVFWFYPNTAEIELWKDERESGQGDHPDDGAAALLDTELEPGKVLQAGFGNGGVRPFYFQKKKAPWIDVSLFKVFATATPTDMTSLKQLSAFDKATARRPTKMEPRDLPYDFWMAKTVTVVERGVEEE